LRTGLLFVVDDELVKVEVAEVKEREKERKGKGS